MGYKENWIGWRVHNLQGKYFFSCDVVFNESVPGHLSPHCGIPIDFASLPPPSIASEANSNLILPLAPNQRPSTSYTPLHLPTLSDTICDCDIIISTHTQHTTRTDTSLLLKTKCHYNDIHTITSFISINDIPPHDHSLHSFEHTNYHNLFNLCFLSSPLPSFWHHITDLSKPLNTYHEALSRPDEDVWISTMKREHDSLEERKAFKRTFLPDGQKAIRVCWTYEFKYNPNGSIIVGKEKAHLVAQGLSQQPEDYGETHAPVIKFTSVQILLAFANMFDYEIMSFDVKTAFLYAWLPYSIYIKQIPGYPEENPRTVLKLLATLYRLKQSAYEWVQDAIQNLRFYGTTTLQGRSCSFYRTLDNSPSSIHYHAILQLATHPYHTYPRRWWPCNIQLPSSIHLVCSRNVQADQFCTYVLVPWSTQDILVIILPRIVPTKLSRYLRQTLSATYWRTGGWRTANQLTCHSYTSYPTYPPAHQMPVMKFLTKTLPFCTNALCKNNSTCFGCLWCLWLSLSCFGSIWLDVKIWKNAKKS